jgi:hypothetical protein
MRRSGYPYYALGEQIDLHGDSQQIRQQHQHGDGYFWTGTLKILDEGCKVNFHTQFYDVLEGAEYQDRIISHLRLTALNQ